MKVILMTDCKKERAIKMVKKKEKKNREEKAVRRETAGAGEICGDKFCPIHGLHKLKLRGRVFEGKVMKKLHSRIVIQFERMKYIKKYERYDKRKTKLHVRLPKCMEDKISVGDLVRVAETRPISKMIHFVVVELVKGGGGAKSGETKK